MVSGLLLRFVTEGDPESGYLANPLTLTAINCLYRDFTGKHRPAAIFAGPGASELMRLRKLIFVDMSEAHSTKQTITITSSHVPVLVKVGLRICTKTIILGTF